MRDAHIFNRSRAMPRMSWSPTNLWNTYQRFWGEKVRETDFANSQRTLFQQRWKSKALVRAYHGDYIPEKVFKRWYLPDTLPDVRPKRKVFGDDTATLQDFALRKTKEKEYSEEQDKKGLPPVGSLMFTELERRIDTFIFRCLFAHSIYEARRLVIHGDVLLNGVKHQNANTRLAPGDMVHVKPSSIRFLQAPKEKIPGASEDSTEKASEESPEKASEDSLEKTSEASIEAVSAESTDKAPEDSSKHAAEEALSEIVAKPVSTPSLTPFNLPEYAAPWIFIPAYIEVNFKTCSAVYVRHPTARPGYSEIATPYDANGDILQFAWEWYARVRPRLKTKTQKDRSPEDRAAKIMGPERSYSKSERYGFGKPKSRLRRTPGFSRR